MIPKLLPLPSGSIDSVASEVHVRENAGRRDFGRLVPRTRQRPATEAAIPSGKYAYACAYRSVTSTLPPPALFGFAPLPRRRSQLNQADPRGPERQMISSCHEIALIVSRKESSPPAGPGHHRSK